MLTTITITMHVSKRLLHWRLSRGISQRDAAKLADVTQSAWQRYEDGKSRPKQRAADAIERLTVGAIRSTEWAETDEEVALRRARTKAHAPARIEPLPEAKAS